MLEKLPESVGHALLNQRAGMEQVLYNQLHALRETHRLDLSSSAFMFNSRLPTRFTADGEGLSPPLLWSGVPAGAAEVVVLVEDADSPTPHPLVHAIVVGLQGAARGEIAEGDLNSPDHRGVGLATGNNSFFKHGWLPPDPPRGHGVHRYVFQVYALSAGPEYGGAPGRRALIEAVLARAIAVGCLIGTYEREGREERGVEETELIDTPVNVGTQGALV